MVESSSCKGSSRTNKIFKAVYGNKKVCEPLLQTQLSIQVAVSPPYVVYMLPDSDIMEDWRLVRKLLERGD